MMILIRSSLAALAWLALSHAAPALAETAPSDTGAAYAKACQAAIAPIPAFDCRSGEVIPITVNGAVPAEYQPGMTCDRPSLLAGIENSLLSGVKKEPCAPYSRALVLRDDTKAQIAVWCRQTQFRPADTHLYDEINMVVHDVGSGSTCWFQAEPKDGSDGIDGSNVQPPGAPGNPWSTPEQLNEGPMACTQCHDASPFMYSPYYAQTKSLPSDPFGKYSTNIGIFNDWPKPMSITTRGNTCTGCHRITNLQSCQTFTPMTYEPAKTEGLDAWGHRFPQSHWMPPGNLHSREQWEVIYRESIAKIEACCQDPTRPECIVAPLPGDK